MILELKMMKTEEDEITYDESAGENENADDC